MRPKSIATVVVVLECTSDRSSMPTLFSVSCSSVRNGRISLTEPTSVVFPTPNPPATTIFTAREGSVMSERPESIDHILEYTLVGEMGHPRRLPDLDQSVVEQIPQQDPHHTEGEIQVGGD